MFTFIYLYIFMYYQCLILVSLFFITIFGGSNIQQYSLTQLLSFIRTYTLKYHFIAVILIQLSGLPPVFLFFLKFNVLLTVLKFFTLPFQFLVLLNLLLGTFYYLQVFNVTNTTLISPYLLKHFLQNKTLKDTTYSNSIFLYQKYWLFASISFINIFSFIFFLDIFLIIDNLYQI